MKKIVCLMALLAALSTSVAVRAQAPPKPPASAPPGTTALCVDQTYSKATTKMTACLGHRGVLIWWGVSKPAPSTAATTVKPVTTTSSGKPPTGSSTAQSSGQGSAPAGGTASTTSSKPPTSTGSATGGSTSAPAPGGAPNLVWLNTASHVYHCYGTPYYGKTKQGAYMTAAQAQAKGGHLASGEHCQ